MRRVNVVDSPPGMTRPSRPSSCSGLRTSTTSAPRRRSIAACSRKLPWTARTPIVTREILRSGERAPAARQEQADRDECERVDREDERRRPLVPRRLEGRLVSDESRQEEVQRQHEEERERVEIA